MCEFICVHCFRNFSTNLIAQTRTIFSDGLEILILLVSSVLSIAVDSNIYIWFYGVFRLWMIFDTLPAVLFSIFEILISEIHINLRSYSPKCWHRHLNRNSTNLCVWFRIFKIYITYGKTFFHMHHIFAKFKSTR